MNVLPGAGYPSGSGWTTGGGVLAVDQIDPWGSSRGWTLTEDNGPGADFHRVFVSSPAPFDTLAAILRPGDANGTPRVTLYTPEPASFAQYNFATRALSGPRAGALELGGGWVLLWTRMESRTSGFGQVLQENATSSVSAYVGAGRVLHGFGPWATVGGPGVPVGPELIEIGASVRRAGIDAAPQNLLAAPYEPASWVLTGGMPAPTSTGDADGGNTGLYWVAGPGSGAYCGALGVFADRRTTRRFLVKVADDAGALTLTLSDPYGATRIVRASRDGVELGAGIVTTTIPDDAAWHEFEVTADQSNANAGLYFINGGAGREFATCRHTLSFGLGAAAFAQAASTVNPSLAPRGAARGRVSAASRGPVT